MGRLRSRETPGFRWVARYNLPLAAVRGSGGEPKSDYSPRMIFLRNSPYSSRNFVRARLLASGPGNESSSSIFCANISGPFGWSMMALRKASLLVARLADGTFASRFLPKAGLTMD